MAMPVVIIWASGVIVIIVDMLVLRRFVIIVIRNSLAHIATHRPITAAEGEERKKRHGVQEPQPFHCGLLMF